MAAPHNLTLPPPTPCGSQEAYKLWLQYDVRTDDITMTVLYFEDTDGLEAAHKA